MSASFVALGSVEAVRPVFLIVMGAFLALIAWRLARTSGLWTSRFLVAGALLLAFGYSMLMPLYHAGVIRYYFPGVNYQGDSSAVIAWHVVKLVVMNSGWLLFGLGVALHANLFPSPHARRSRAIRTVSPHESVA